VKCEKWHFADTRDVHRWSVERDAVKPAERGNAGQQQFLPADRVTERQVATTNAIAQIAFGELLFLLVAMGCGNSAQTKRIRGVWVGKSTESTKSLHSIPDVAERHAAN